MEEITFLIQGSAQEPYEARFTRHDGALKATCTCPAGIKGSYCKHRIGILQGSAESVVSGNADQVKEAAAWLKDSELERALARLDALERQQNELKKEVSRVKKSVSRIMTG